MISVKTKMPSREVRELILLIRAGSTVLSELNHKAGPAVSFRESTSKPLPHADRIAVLFVTKSEIDVAAVSYVRSPRYLIGVFMC